MIVAEYWSKGRERVLLVRGHANTAPKGQDLVCAGVSALVYALAESIPQWSENLEIDIRDGFAQLRATAKKGCFRQLQAAFEVTKNGLELMGEKCGGVRVQDLGKEIQDILRYEI